MGRISIVSTRVSPHLEVDMASLAAFCDKWGISRLGVFGSVLRDDFTSDSDVDVLVSFQPDRWPSLTQRSVAEDELSAILGHRAEIVIREGLEGWRVSPSVRQNILSEVKEVYGNA